MLPPLPRRSVWAYCFAHSPSRVSLPRKGHRVGLRIVLFEACSAFTRVAACTLALSPIRDTHSEGFSYFVTSIAAPVASGWSGRRMGLTPTGKRRLVTAHTRSGPSYGLRSRNCWPRLCCSNRSGGAPHRRRCDLACAINEEFYKWTERAVLQRDGCDRSRGNRQFDRQLLNAWILGREPQHGTGKNAEKATAVKQSIPNWGYGSNDCRFWNVKAT